MRLLDSHSLYVEVEDGGHVVIEARTYRIRDTPSRSRRLGGGVAREVRHVPWARGHIPVGIWALEARTVEHPVNPAEPFDRPILALTELERCDGCDVHGARS